MRRRLREVEKNDKCTCPAKTTARKSKRVATKCQQRHELRPPAVACSPMHEAIQLVMAGERESAVVKECELLCLILRRHPTDSNERTQPPNGICAVRATLHASSNSSEKGWHGSAPPQLALSPSARARQAAMPAASHRRTGSKADSLSAGDATDARRSLESGELHCRHSISAETGMPVGLSCEIRRDEIERDWTACRVAGTAQEHCIACSSCNWSGIKRLTPRSSCPSFRVQRFVSHRCMHARGEQAAMSLPLTMLFLLHAESKSFFGANGEIRRLQALLLLHKHTQAERRRRSCRGISLL